MENGPVVKTEFSGLGEPKCGKVRDTYIINKETSLMVATDRLSAFNVILPTPIDDKGKILTQMSAFWFWYLCDITNDHLLTMDVTNYPAVCDPYQDILRGRSMLIKRADVIPYECVVRGYITGSGWESYLKNGTVCGIALPNGLIEAQQLPEPIFTPTRKSKDDEPISFDEMANEIGIVTATKLKNLSLALYVKAAEHARKNGIIIADTKFEFGWFDSSIILIDEALTPDSSRFWLEELYQPGSSPVSLDKQFVRDYLKKKLGWKEGQPVPELPRKVVLETRVKYVEAFRRITGRNFE